MATHAHTASPVNSSALSACPSTSSASATAAAEERTIVDDT